MPANARPEANQRRTLGFDAARFDEVWRVVYGPMTVKQIAAELGTNYANFVSMRTGTRNVSLDVIVAIRSKLPNVDFDELFPIQSGEAA